VRPYVRSKQASSRRSIEAGVADQRLAVANPEHATAEFTVMVLLESRQLLAREHTLPPRERMTIDVNDWLGGLVTAASAVVYSRARDVLERRRPVLGRRHERNERPHPVSRLRRRAGARVCATRRVRSGPPHRNPGAFDPFRHARAR
jgi:hypothetical protein